MTHEPYAYAANNPINATDPLGLWPSWDDVKSAAGTAVDVAKDVGGRAVDVTVATVNAPVTATTSAVKMDWVVEGLDPARVIVFGSVARGEAGADSDLDLLVLFDDLDAADRRQLMGRIRTAIDAPVPIDVLVAEVSEFEADKDANGSPCYWPAKDGRVVYDRSAA